MTNPTDLGPFDTLEVTFGLLCTGPRPLALEARAIVGLPARELPLTELRSLLLHPSTSHQVRDAALGELLRRARHEGGRWTIGLSGVLLYGLRRAVAPLVAVCPGKAADIEAETIAGLLEAISATNPERSRLASRLTWLARNWAKELVVREFAEEAARPGHVYTSVAPQWTDRHPDLVLVKAVREQVLEPEDAALIGETRLGEMTLEEAATALGIERKAAYERRRTAEHRLRAWITGPDYEPGFLEFRPVHPYLVRRGRPRQGRTIRQTDVCHHDPVDPPRR